MGARSSPNVWRACAAARLAEAVARSRSRRPKPARAPRRTHIALGRARHITRWLWLRGPDRHSSRAVLRLALGRPTRDYVRAVRYPTARLYEPSAGRQERACARAK